MFLRKARPFPPRKKTRQREAEGKIGTKKENNKRKKAQYSAETEKVERAATIRDAVAVTVTFLA